MNGSKSSSSQHQVLLSQRNFQDFCQLQHHLSTGFCPSRFKKTDVTLRHLTSHGEIKLAEAALAAPLFEEQSKRVESMICGTGTLLHSKTNENNSFDYLAGNCFDYLLSTS